MQNYKTLKDKIGENLDNLGNDFLDTTPKAWFMKARIDQLDFIKIKNYCSAKTLTREWEDKPQTVRKYLQKTYPIKKKTVVWNIKSS